MRSSEEEGGACSARWGEAKGREREGRTRGGHGSSIRSLLRSLESSKSKKSEWAGTRGEPRWSKRSSSHLSRLTLARKAALLQLRSTAMLRVRFMTPSLLSRRVLGRSPRRAPLCSRQPRSARATGGVRAAKHGGSRRTSGSQGNSPARTAKRSLVRQPLPPRPPSPSLPSSLPPSLIPTPSDVIHSRSTSPSSLRRLSPPAQERLSLPLLDFPPTLLRLAPPHRTPARAGRRANRRPSDLLHVAILPVQQLPSTPRRARASPASSSPSRGSRTAQASPGRQGGRARAAGSRDRVVERAGELVEDDSEDEERSGRREALDLQSTASRRSTLRVL